MTRHLMAAVAVAALLTPAVAAAQPAPAAAARAALGAPADCPSGASEVATANPPPPGPAFTPPPPGAPRPMRADPYEGKIKVLFIGDTLTGNQVAHDSVYHAMASLERAGRDRDIAVFIRTDYNNITLGPVFGTCDYGQGGAKQSAGRNLDFFDVVVFYTNGETRLGDDQKRDMMAWLRAGHGFVGIHTATATGVYWPEYGRMIGGYFDNHPWGVTDGAIIVERPDFPGMAGFIANPSVRDEFYVMLGEPYSREDTDVLARLDASKLDLTIPQLHRTDGDFPVAWIRNEGEGRVFYSDLGHPDSAWDDPRVVDMYLEAITWAAGRTDYPVRPHPLEP